MKIRLHSSALMKYSLLILLVALTASCGGDGTSSSGNVSNPSTANDSSASLKKRDLVSYMYTDPTALPLKGNGIWNYSVATDYYYGSMSTPSSPSLAVDLKNNPDANIEYVFATFISLSMGYKKDGSPPSVISDACPSDSSVPLITYYALPQTNPSIYSGALGDCVAGKTATAYYAGINKNAPLKVVPIAEYADDTFPTAISTANSSYIKSLAASLANKIVQDPSTYGLGIDNEKSINSFSPSQGQANEEIFFGELARILGLGNKFLFLFDAPASANTLYATYKNIVILAPLYDLDNSDPSQANAYNPDHLTSPYTTSVNNMASGTLSASTGPGQSVMFVVPASATSTIWDYEMVYNYPYSIKTPYSNPIYNALPPGILANSNGNTCATPERDAITMTVLNALVNSSYTVGTFLSVDNCYYFANTTPLSLYFSASLDAITKAKSNSNRKANYLGAAMYAWRISGANDINGIKTYYSGYTYTPWKDLNVSYQVGPPDIQSSSWSIFNKWAILDK